MCGPAAPLIVSVVISAISAAAAANNAKEQADYQSKVASNNQKVAEWQAADAVARGNTEAANVRRKYAAMQGTQAASLAARGLDISEGSANALLTDTDFFGAYDQAITKSNAAREAWGYKVQAGNFAGDAAAYSAQADARNPLLEGVMAGAKAYASGGGSFGAGGGPGQTSGGSDLINNSSTVDPRWYGSKSWTG